MREIIIWLSLLLELTEEKNKKVGSDIYVMIRDIRYLYRHLAT